MRLVRSRLQAVSNEGMRERHLPAGFLPSLPVLCLSLLSLSVIACSRYRLHQQVTPSLTLTSSSFSGGVIARKCTCDGTEVSPQLSWQSPPPRTQAFALIALDEDTLLISLIGPFVHWVMFNIPPGTRRLPEAIPPQKQLPDSSLQGMNDFDKVGYAGPCPRLKARHRYLFTLYALDAKLALPAGATMEEVLKAMDGHILAEGELTGSYQR
jgi:Raf kinase inhibitor-like YbhB/YbcL family protein